MEGDVVEVKEKEKEKEFEEHLKKAYESYRELQRERCRSCRKKESCNELTYETELHTSFLMDVYLFTLEELHRRTSMPPFACDGLLVFEVMASRMYRYIRWEILNELKNPTSATESSPHYIA